MEEEAKQDHRRVQDVAENGDYTPPQRFIQKESNRPAVDPISSDVPVVDFSKLFKSDDASEQTKLMSSLKCWGFFQAIGHGIPASLLDEVRRETKLFFHQSKEVKQKYFSTGLEGYGNDRVISDEQILDWSDRLYLLVEPEEDRKLELWPETPDSFRETLNEYTKKLREVVDFIFKSLAKLLKLEESYFINQLGEKSQAFARFNYYPRCSRPDLVFGIKPHADGSAITVVLQDEEVEGLQVLKDGAWVRVPIVLNALLVNMGDQMEIMSNGQYMSPIHRVVTNCDYERISVAMFYAVNPEKEIEPAPGLVGEGRPRLYKKVKVKDYLEYFFTTLYEGKRAIHCAKV